MKILYICFLLAILFSAPNVRAQSELSRRDVITGLKVPVEITWGPDDWIWFAEKGGRIGRVDPSTGELRTVYQIGGLWETNESGLLGMAVFPTLRDTPYVFLAWTYYEDQEVRLKLVRFKYDGRTLYDSTMIFHRVAANAYTNGGRLTVTPDRKILMTVGDADQPMFAQNHFFLGGKVLRMNLDGSVPSDNPSRTAPTPINLLWSSGHRDGRGIVALPNGTVFSVEQGQDSVDELNIIQRRRNYGWPRVIGNCDQVAELRFCTDSNVVQPVRRWVNNIYPSGLDYYNNTAIPEFANSLLMVTLDEQDLRQLSLSGNTVTQETVHFDREFGRLRDLCIAPDGRVFLATSNRDERGVGSNFAGADKIIEIGGNRALALLGTPVITGDSAGVFEAGDTVRATFTASNFNPNNVFTLQISDGVGSFATPRTIGSVSGVTGGSITGLVPCDTLGLNRYRFRVVSSAPSATKTDATNGFRIIASPTGIIYPSRDMKICPGDSVVFRGRLGVVNRWSTGEVGDSIIVRSPGNYFVVAYSNGCGRTSDTISVTELPLPQPRIVVLGANTLDAGARYVTYRWSRDGQPIADANGRTIVATESGSYTVTVSNDEGCSSTSESFDIQISSAPGERASDAGIRLYPHPAREHVTVEVSVNQASVMEIAITDIRGREVLSVRDDARRGPYRRDIDVRSLPPGTYVIQARCGVEAWSARFTRE